ncbi:MAG: indole-3-glycerol phosphate synthase TrpC [bacterium]|nr:indole-3-glycerol phosphate synthase TrpC [bacterium]
MILKEILKNKEREVRENKGRIPLELLKNKCAGMSLPRSFAAAIKRDGFISVIAESKKASPSKGDIAGSYNPVAVGARYEAAGADAISVLTDKKYFKGSIGDLTEIKAGTGLPVLRKDFIIDPYQIYESKAAGADAILLIAKALSKDKIKEMLETAFNLKLDVLVEVHSGEELSDVLDINGIKIIGVNNRNLGNFKVDIGISEDLLPRIPQGIIRVSESGFFSAADAARAADAGADALLVGEALMKAKDKKALIDGFKILKHQKGRCV